MQWKIIILVFPPLNEDILSIFPSPYYGPFYIIFSYLLIHIYKHY